MSKYLVFSDFHVQGVNSRNRLGNYFEDCLKKLDEILSIAKENKCDAILDAGDLLEVKNPAYNVIDEIADRVEKNNIPIYSLFGNHCMHSGYIENSSNTGLAHLQRRSKLFNYLNSIECNLYKIEGFEYRVGVEEDIKKNGIFIQSPITKEVDQYEGWNIAIVHAMITPTKFFDQVSHVQCKDIKTNADLILCGHYHTPFYKKIENTEFLNIGCCGRLNINEAKIEPSVLLLDTEKRSYEIIKLKSAKKGSEIFDLSKYEEIKENERSIDEFIASLNSATWQASDLNSQIEIIAKEQNVEKEVIEYVKEKIKESKI